MHLKELLTEGSIAFVLTIAGVLSGYVLTLLITRNFGADVMGIFSLSTTVLTIASIFARFGLDTTLLRFVAEYSTQNRFDLVKEVYIKSLKIAILFSLILSILFYVLSSFIALNIFHKDYMATYLKIVSFAILPMVLLFMNAQSLRGLKKTSSYSFFQSVSIFLIASILIWSVSFFIRQDIVPVVSYVLSVFLSAVFSQLMWLKSSNLDAISHSNFLKIPNILSISLPMLLSSSMTFIMTWTDTILLGIYRTEAEVGLYNVALRVSMVTAITLIAVNSIAAPKFAEFYARRDVGGLEKIVRQSTKLIFWTSTPIIIVLALFPSFVLGIFGPEFKSGSGALRILLCGQFVNVLSGSVGFILQMTGKQKVFQKIIMLSMMFNIALNMVFIPQYGINGAAIINIISMALWNITSVIYIKRHYGITTMYIPFMKIY